MFAVGSIAELVGRLPSDRRLVVLIDGGSGSGKTDLSRMLAAAMPDATQLVSLDNIYPGWHGLAAGAEMVPVIAGPQPSYTTWDWEANRPKNHVHLDPCQPIVIEGCGALTPASAPLASLSIWCDVAEPIRKRRALARDGAGYAPWWDTWAAQEQTHWHDHRPWELADVIVKSDTIDTLWDARHDGSRAATMGREQPRRPHV